VIPPNRKNYATTDIQSQIYLFGGVVTSWTQPSGDEVLFVRPDAKFDKSKPISGGIPHCFPQVEDQLGILTAHNLYLLACWACPFTSTNHMIPLSASRVYFQGDLFLMLITADLG